MDNKKIQSILEEALEQEIPSSEIKLWPAIQADLAAGKHSVIQQGEKMNLLKQLRRAAYTVATAAFLLALVFITPQGRVFAQEFVSQFFTRTESDTFYTEPSVLTFEDTTPFHAECGMAMTPRCSVEQVRRKVDFEIKELGTLPPGLHFVGATGGPDFIELKYGYPERLDGNLNVIIEATGRPSTVGTGITAPSASIKPVRIGDLPAEYTNGALFQHEEGNVTWQPDYPMQTLRWEDSGSTYTLFYYSPIYPLTKEDLVRLAGSMTLEPVAKDVPPR